MKKFLYIALSLIFAGASFTACDDDDEEGIVDAHPEQSAAATYNGTWTVETVTSDATTTESVDGTVTIEPSDTAYICFVTVNVPGKHENKTSSANIVRTHSGYIFSNYVSKNVGTSGFAGIINSDSKLSVSFSFATSGWDDDLGDFVDVQANYSFQTK